MAFGIDDILFIVLSAVASGTAAKAAQPDQPNIGGSLPGGVSSGLSAGFELPIPAAVPPGQAIEQAGSPIDLSPTSAVIEQAAQTLAAQGPPPTVPLEPTGPPPPPPGEPGSQIPGPPALPKGPQKEVPKQPSIGEILAASPEAIVAVSQLLGIGQQQQISDRPAPVPGGTVGNVVPGFGLPQTSTIGQLLAQIPRLR